MNYYIQRKISKLLDSQCFHKNGTTTKQRTVPLAYFIASIKTNNYNKFDGITQTNLSRDKVEIVICFTTPFQTNRPRHAECDWHQPTSITRMSQSNCHINSYSDICVLIFALLLLIYQTVDNLNNCVC